MSVNENSLKAVPTVTELNACIIRGRIPEAEEMIQSGVEPNDKSLEIAVTFWRTELAETLLLRYPTLSRKGLLYLATLQAAAGRNQAMLKMLLRNGVNDFTEEIEGNTPLTHLINSGSPDLMKVIYELYPAIIEIELPDQKNLLDLANQSNTGRLLAEYLVSLGMKPTVSEAPEEEITQPAEQAYPNLFPAQSAPVTTTSSIYPKVTPAPEEISTSSFPRIIPRRHVPSTVPGPVPTQDLKSTETSDSIQNQQPTIPTPVPTQNLQPTETPDSTQNQQPTIPTPVPTQNLQPTETPDSTSAQQQTAPTALPPLLTELVHSLATHRSSQFSSSALKTVQKVALLEAVVNKVQLTHGDRPFATKGEFFTRRVTLTLEDLPAEKRSHFPDHHPLLNKEISVATVLNFQRKFGNSLTTSSKRFFKDPALTNKDKVTITLQLALGRIAAEEIPAERSAMKRQGILNALSCIANKPNNASLSELLKIHVQTVSGAHIKAKNETVLDIIKQHRNGGLHLFSTQSYRDLSQLVGRSELRRS